MLDDSALDYLTTIPEVVRGRQRLAGRSGGTVDMSVQLPAHIKSAVFDGLGLTLDTSDAVPMRWIKGDTRAHADRAATAFERTYLMYVTGSTGSLIVDGDAYPIERGTGYVFDEGLQHETVGTGDEPRLLLGPMNERTAPVGVPPVPEETSACCVTAEGMAKKPYDTRADITVGKNIIIGPSVTSRPMSYEDRYKMFKARSAQLK